MIRSSAARFFGGSNARTVARTTGQRVVNKRAGRANTLFVSHAPPDEFRVENERHSLDAARSPGEGVETERWQDVRDRPVWLFSCAGTITPKRYVGRGDRHRRKRFSKRVCARGCDSRNLRTCWASPPARCRDGSRGAARSLLAIAKRRPEVLRELFAE
jgi:hypothetical protein